MTEQQIKRNIKQFVDEWQGKGYEKGESQPFWIALLRKVLGVEEPEQFIVFEEQVHLDHTSFIDGMIPATHVMIEQKSAGKDLNAAIKQSDGSYLNPFQQAKRYSAELPYSERPRYIVTCNFREFYIYDMEKPQSEPEKLLLQDLPDNYYRLKFMVDTGNQNIKREEQISKDAGTLIGRIYDAFSTKYHDPMSEREMQSLNVLCVRLVFCMYAEDADVFNRKQFQEFVQSYNAENLKTGLLELFKVLDTKLEDREDYMAPRLAAFPYVNGGLFENENIIIPQLDEDIVEKLVEACEFDWSHISPTIFGALFESTLNPIERRKGGMHYTSIENIHKVIDPLFLDDLKAEFKDIQKDIEKERPKEYRRTEWSLSIKLKRRLKQFQDKLASLKFLDPACGSGNFLTETYSSIRIIENEVISLLYNNLGILYQEINPIKVSISQFYGIEINDFAVAVAKTALWIAENQMMKATEGIVNMDLNFLPLKTNANIVEDNALRIDWNTVIPASELNYIMGNPPFEGGMLMSAQQKNDLAQVMQGYQKVGEMDFVCGWYEKCREYINGNRTECALVSTNSIVQGQQAVTLWKPLFEHGIQINFAYRTFKWKSESSRQAAVHCVIIGFAKFPRPIKTIYDDRIIIRCQQINNYLVCGDSIFVESRNKPLCDVPLMHFGNMPRDGGGFILYEDDIEYVRKHCPETLAFIHLYVGAEEYINKKLRWCLWLDGVEPEKYIKNAYVMNRIKIVREARLKSKADATRQMAQTPHLFAQRTQPVGVPYIIVPRVSSENRRYVPMGFLPGNVVASDAAQIIPNATLYHFGVLTSNVHMAWMRTVAGRLKSDYRYSKDIVYNNFPWPEVTDAQKAKIEQTAKKIIEAREKYSDVTFADMYGVNMPVFTDLLQAHQANDRAVMEAYGFDWRNMTESQCVAELMGMYQELVSRN